MHSGSQWIEIAEDWNLPRGRVWCLLAARGGSLWVAIDNELWALRGGSTKFDLVERLRFGVKRMADANDGAIWVSELRGPLRRFTLTEDGVTTSDTGLRFGSESMLFDRDGTLWVTDLPNGVRRVPFPDRVFKRSDEVDSVRIESYQSRDGLSGNVADQLLEDKEGNIWVGTTKGVDRFRYSHVIPLTALTSLRHFPYAGSGGRRPIH